MTPDQEAAAETVTQELTAGYSDQLIPGAAEQMGKLWFNVGAMPADRRSEEIAKRMASPLADRWRDPSYDPKSAPTPLERALQQQGHRLADGSAEKLATRWAPELAGRDPAKVAGEVARRLDQREHWDHLKVRPAAPEYEDRVYAVLTANFAGELTLDGKMAIARERGREFARMSDSQIIGSVAGSLRAPAIAGKYGTGATIEAGDPRLQGLGEYTTPPRERTTRTNIDGSTVKAPAPTPTPSSPPASRDPGGRFAPPTAGGSTPPTRRRSTL